MTPEDILALAQKGDPKVIAAIFNRTTEPYGVFVRVARRSSRLYILVEGDVAKHQDALVSFMQKSLQKLKLRSIDIAIVYGRPKGEVAMAWSETIKIPPDANAAGGTSISIPPFTPNAPFTSNNQARRLPGTSDVSPSKQASASPRSSPRSSPKSVGTSAHLKTAPKKKM